MVEGESGGAQKEFAAAIGTELEFYGHGGRRSDHGPYAAGTVQPQISRKAAVEMTRGQGQTQRLAGEDIQKRFAALEGLIQGAQA